MPHHSWKKAPYASSSSSSSSDTKKKGKKKAAANKDDDVGAGADNADDDKYLLDMLAALKRLPVGRSRLGSGRQGRIVSSSSDSNLDARLKKLHHQSPAALKKESKLSCAAKAKCCTDIDTLRILLLQRQSIDKRIKTYEKALTDGWELDED